MNVNDRVAAGRATVNAAIRAAVGTNIDVVIDYASDPEIGTDPAPFNQTLFTDGLLPTDGSTTFTGGQGRLARIYIAALEKFKLS